MRRFETLWIGPEEDGAQVKDVLRRRLGFSETRIRSVKFDPEGLILNGTRVTVRTRLRQGDELRVLIGDSGNSRPVLLPQPGPLSVLWEDEDLILVDKPAGLVCHPSAGHYADTLANRLQAHFLEQGSDARVHLAGRLDKETSGVVLCAKNAYMAEKLRKLRADGTLVKTYLAAAAGEIGERTGEIRTPLETVRDPQTGILVMRVSDDPAREAVTSFDVIGRGDGMTVLAVRIRTGRMHQIRAHLASAGHPLIGDALYGEADPRIGRTALHARSVSFPHPLTGEIVKVCAPLPEDMTKLTGRITEPVI